MHSSLRALTAEQHKRLDSMMSQHDLSDLDGYLAFLDIMAAGFACVESWLAANWALAPDGVEFTRRLPLIEADRIELLSALPDKARGRRASLPARNLDCEEPSQGDVLGALYVLEGSRLGGKVLKTRVQRGLPTRFLDDNKPILAWRKLLDLIAHLPSEELDRAGQTASSVFEIFLDIASVFTARA